MHERTRPSKPLDLSLTSDRDGRTERGALIKSGTTVEYCGHVVGGMVRVRFDDGTEDIMHPHCFSQLRS
jgi:hypothetical protein